MWVVCRMPKTSSVHGLRSCFRLRCARGKLKIGRTHLWASCLFTACGTASVSPLSSLSQSLSLPSLPPSLFSHFHSPWISPSFFGQACTTTKRPEMGHHFPRLSSIRRCGRAGCGNCLHLTSLWVIFLVGMDTDLNNKDSFLIPKTGISTLFARISNTEDTPMMLCSPMSMTKTKAANVPSCFRELFRTKQYIRKEVLLGWKQHLWSVQMMKWRAGLYVKESSLNPNIWYVVLQLADGHCRL